MRERSVSGEGDDADRDVYVCACECVSVRASARVSMCVSLTPHTALPHHTATSPPP